MDDTLRNPAAGRHEDAHNAGDHPPNADACTAADGRAETKPATQPVEPSTLESDIAVICQWCPELHILRMQRRDVDVIVTIQIGKDRKSLRIMRNGKDLRISHGICQPCRERMRA